MILGDYPTEEFGLERERWWIKQLWEAGHPLVNVTEGGQTGYPIGRPQSYLTRAKKSLAAKKYFESPDARARMSAITKKLWESTEHRTKMLAVVTGRVGTPEMRAKLSVANVGKSYTSDTKAKISEALKKLWASPEYRTKMSMAHKGKPWSPAQRAAYERRFTKGGTNA